MKIGRTLRTDPMSPAKDGTGCQLVGRCRRYPPRRLRPYSRSHLLVHLWQTVVIQIRLEGLYR